MLLALTLACGTSDVTSVVDGALETCPIAVEPGTVAPPLSLRRADGTSTTLQLLRDGGLALVALAPAPCPECGRLRTLLAGWERQHPGLVAVLVSDGDEPAPAPPGPVLRGGELRASRAELEEWADSRTEPRVFLVDREGTVVLRRDGFAAVDARAVAEGLRSLVGR